MAKKDFTSYLLNVQSQVIATKADLKDFEEGLKDGHVTEEQVQDLYDEYNRLNENYQRLLYVGYLLELPKQKWFKKKYKEKYANIEDYLKTVKADEDSVIKENEIVISLIKKEMKKLTPKTKKKKDGKK